MKGRKGRGDEPERRKGRGDKPEGESPRLRKLSARNKSAEARFRSVNEASNMRAEARASGKC